MKKPHIKWALGALVSLMLGTQAEAAPLKIGYSDWPGWVAWQVAIDKGWLKQAGVDATFEWFDYSASMDAFSGGKIDGVLGPQTTGAIKRFRSDNGLKTGRHISLRLAELLRQKQRRP